MKQKSLSIFLALSSLFPLQTFATPMELSRILPKKTAQADVMTVGADPATAEKMIRLMAEFKKNPKLLAELMAKSKRGEAMPYDSRMKMSESDYQQMLAGMKKMGLFKTGTASLIVTEQTPFRFKLSATNRGSILKKGLIVDLKTESIESPVIGKLQSPAPFTNPSEGLGMLEGYTWKKTTPTSQRQIILAKRSSDQCLLVIRVKQIKKAAKLKAENEILQFPCR